METSEKYKQIKTLKKATEFVLEKFAYTRNSDTELVKRVCDMFGYDPISKASGIERCRRWFNQRGEYLPTSWEVAKQRGMMEDEWKKALGYHV